MIRLPVYGAACAAALALVACGSAIDMEPGHAVNAADRTAAIQPDADGHCWEHDVTPAVIEQVPGEVLVIQADIAPDGTVLRAPVYRRAPVPRIVQPRAELRFEAPCPDRQTPDFIGSLQRALTARGYYDGPITTTLDPLTREAISRYQTERGLDSDRLSLETARDLGLVAVDLDGLSQNG